MHEPLTAAEYRAIAANLQLPANAFIDGAFVPAGLEGANLLLHLW